MTCKHCGLEITAAQVARWKHLDGGYLLCYVDGKRPGTTAEAEDD